MTSSFPSVAIQVLYRTQSDMNFLENSQADGGKIVPDQAVDGGKHHFQCRSEKRYDTRLHVRCVDCRWFSGIHRK